MRLDYDAYEDNAGNIYLFGFGDDGDVEWAQVYRSDMVDLRSGWTLPELAGADWAHIMLTGEEPIENGWDNLGKAERIDLCRELTEDVPATLIAHSRWSQHPMGIWLEPCGNSGIDFAIAAGVAARCPECGEIVPAVLDGSPDGFSIPRACEACGCELPPLSDL